MRDRRATIIAAVLAALVLGLATPSVAATDEAGRYRGTQILAAAAAYPGLGQLLNGAEAKAAVIGAAESFLVSGLVIEDRRTRNAFRMYQETGGADWYSEYSTHYDRRQTLLWWVMGAALYAIADAYVDAYLIGFGESLSPELEGPLDLHGSEREERLAVGLAIRF